MKALTVWPPVVCPSKQTIVKAWPDSKVSLEKLRGDLNTSLEKLMTREKILNEQFEHMMQQYRGARTNLTGLEVSERATHMHVHMHALCHQCLVSCANAP